MREAEPLVDAQRRADVVTEAAQRGRLLARGADLRDDAAQRHLDQPHRLGVRDRCLEVGQQGLCERRGMCMRVACVRMVDGGTTGYLYPHASQGRGHWVGVGGGWLDHARRREAACASAHSKGRVLETTSSTTMGTRAR